MRYRPTHKEEKQLTTVIAPYPAGPLATHTSAFDVLYEKTEGLEVGHTSGANLAFRANHTDLGPSFTTTPEAERPPEPVHKL